jgi:hypothetical protein
MKKKDGEIIAEAIGGVLVPVLCIIGAIIVAASGHDGWGWLLFLAWIFA